jgi:HSP20 family protein
MTIDRFNPYTDMGTLRSSMDRFMDRFFADFGRPVEGDDYAGQTFSPAVDIKETQKEYLVTAEVPGIKKEDIHIEVADNLLTLKGERKFEKEDKNESYHRVERSFGAFTRTFTLPTSVKTEAIEAKFHDGLLSVRIPKAEEKVPKKIEIKG